MNKTNFLRTLRGELAPLTSQEQEQIIDEYVSIFEIKKEEGLTDEQIITELGDPRKIAAQFLAEFNYDGAQYSNKHDDKYQNGQIRNNEKRTGLFIGMVIFHALVGLWLFVSAWCVIIALYISAGACLIGLLTIITLSNATILGVLSYLLIVIGFGLLLFSLANLLAGLLIKGTSTHIRWLKSLI